jgi:predicted ester cyclase
MGSANEVLVRRWFDEIWNRGNIDAAGELLAPLAVLHEAGMTGEPSMDLEEFTTHWRAIRLAIPDIHFEMVFAFEAGEHVAARLVVTGTHSGPGLGLEPSGRTFRVTGMVIARVRDGKMVEGWNNFDLLGLFAQVQAVKRPGGL